MPYATILILAISAGIVGYAGVFHILLCVAHRPRDPTQLLFGLLALSVAAHTLAVLSLHTATSVAGYLFVHKYFFGPTALASFLALLWFVAFYAGVRPRRFLLAMSLWIELIIALHLYLPFGILYLDMSGLRQITLPWGDQVALARGTPNPLRAIFDLFNLVLFAFFFYALARQYRSGKRRAAVVLGVAIGLLLVGRIVDTLSVLAVSNSILTTELAFLALVMAMGLALSHRIAQTDSELHVYQEHLHDLVAARTAELTQANEQLSLAARENASLYQRAVAARERLTALYQAAQAISSASLDARQVYAEMHSAIVRIMSTDTFGIILIDAARQEAEEAYLADKTGVRPGRRYPLARSFADYMLRRNASVRIDDLSALPQDQFARELLDGQPNAASCVAALLRGGEQILGVLLVESDAKSAYTDEDQEALELLAAHAAIALEHAHHYQQVHDLAAIEERTHLARELHDSVTQTLFAASILAEALPVVWRENPAEGRRSLIKLRQHTRGALAEMRTLLFELRPASLGAADMATLLRQMGEALTSHAHLSIELTIDGAAQPPPDVKIVLYRIAQESLNNIAKHACATQVWVTLHTAPDQFLLSICDDGQGFDPGAISEEHMGVRIMAERAAGVGAYLHIDSAPGRGARVSVSWPNPATTDAG